MPLVALGTALRQHVVDRLSEHYSVIATTGPLRPDTMAPAAREATALVTLGILPTGAALMDALPALGLIACYGTGFDGIDLDAASDRGIQVAHSPGGNASSVADMAMALILATTRQTVVADRFVRAGLWRAHPTPELPVMPGLTGSKVGIYGLGTIGAKVAARAQAFEVEVGYHGRAPHADTDLPYFPSLRSLAKWADVLVLTARAMPDTPHAVDAEVLDALGPNGHLVNVARGSLVDQDALVTALRSGAIAGAALDVYETEPMPSGELLSLPNVVLSPHISGATLSAQRAAVDMLLANLDAFFNGGLIPHLVPSFS